ncbi:MAG TPA: YchJ family protein [Candidatus Krumholzibacteria bacterium]|nr:YchJ family protein [Candidatus Krumholzibacteria bacterium]HPD72368.1 YchJ family protein [Candidatus Krumholzibacteria bacterium]HRY40700.1 YchJ family protein [Candidatus Krumholzibacteria bacterium]
MDCPCGSGRQHEVCCRPIIAGEQPAPTAEALMRARYSAYALAEVDFLLESLHPDHRADHDPEGVRKWATGSEWHGLEILGAELGGADDATGRVEFACEYTYEGERRRHHEHASFERHEGRWYFVSGEPVKSRPFVREAPKVGRNDPCPCGSGKKYKKCCGSAGA